MTSPQDRVANAAGLNPQMIDPVLGGVRVLVADDEQEIRRSVHELLTPCGCSVDQAHDGSAAIRMLQAKQYDLVISDIAMPGANGFDVLSAAKAASPKMQVILVTSFCYDAHHCIVRAGSEGLAGVILKPFAEAQLLDQCRQAMADPAG